MANTFNTFQARPSFELFNKTQDSGDYIYNKKAKTTFCFPNNCKPIKTINNQSDLLLFNRSNNLKYYANNINRANLNINLITKLDLNNIPVLQSNITPFSTPTEITTSLTPYSSYSYDPSGLLFGNTTCGINNYVNYMIYTK